MKKKIIMSVLTIALAAIIGALIPMRTYAVSAANTTEYISEVKIGIGKTEEEASRDLLSGGYTILKKDGSYADLNEDADDNLSSAKKVYLGYKTTTDVKYAVTDLAVMNMKGGYSIRDYEVLMENQLKTQVIPFVNRFIATLNEYRANLKSENPANKARAEYMRFMLNKLKDDDTGALIGDLLVNETKYEMGDEKYSKLSADEKKKHADILTIIMQANGKATLSMETLLTKASDSSDTTWMERLQGTTLDTLKEGLGDVDITEQDNELDKLYYDDAQKILEKWSVFSDALYNYDDKANEIANLDEYKYADEIATMDQFDEKNNNAEKNGDAIVANMEAQNDLTLDALNLELVAAYDRLDETEYDFDGGSTLLEFFEQEASAFDGDDIRNLYPLVASLSAGQIAGLDFLSLQDLVTIATAKATSYDTSTFENAEIASIYEGVNREVFEKGKVALTNEALRAEAAKNNAVTDFSLSATSYVLWGATAVAIAGTVIGVGYMYTYSFNFTKAAQAIKNVALKVDMARFNCLNKIADIKRVALGADSLHTVDTAAEISNAKAAYTEQLVELVGKNNAKYVQDTEAMEAVKQLSTKSRICKFLGAAFTVAMAALAAYSIYSTIKELMDYYKVDYSPIPKYIVEETDITTYNAKGEKIFTGNNNTSAYYRAVECNRPTDDKNYKVLQNFADLNGDVGKQWLALYAVKFEGKSPIIASSLKVVTGSTALPDGYETGIHMFGETAAFDLNSAYYVFNKEATDVYVYFKTDDSVTVPVTVASAAGSNFTVGSVFLYGGIGAVVGAAIAVVVLLVAWKKKEGAAA